MCGAKLWRYGVYFFFTPSRKGRAANVRRWDAGFAEYPAIVRSFLKERVGSWPRIEGGASGVVEDVGPANRRRLPFGKSPRHFAYLRRVWPSFFGRLPQVAVSVLSLHCLWPPVSTSMAEPFHRADGVRGCGRHADMGLSGKLRPGCLGRASSQYIHAQNAITMSLRAEVGAVG
ncbi:hypothetical protein VUR80DRAFT_8476 [Thermomyces stellatus]